ncbi:cholesterol transporter ABCA5-like isoform X2 [Ruditapes philippinarum]|uniref:cholesterol transporter ABCA5-like isoform X2 n=1 Tax=Ruditapes philippinarum TaxID=129788 RepID=UPI00295A8180|nr:cholesterol transporter ABCA5-like isoform X2 [Ruditapes philippinarum]
MAKATFWTQFKVLVWKNILLKKRNKKQTIQEILMPIYFIAILAMIKYFVKPKTWPEIQNFPPYHLNDTKTFSTISGNILVSPDSSQSHRVMKEAADILKDIYRDSVFNVVFYNNTEDSTKAYKASPKNVVAGIILNFDVTKPTDDLNYAIRMPYTDIANSNPSNIYQDQSQCRGGNGLDKSSCVVNTYIYTGFSAIQLAVDTALTRITFNKSDINPPEVSVRMMPKPSFIPDTSYIQILASLYFIIAYSPFINFLTVNLVAEKEKKIKEGMKMMGLRDAAFWASWGFVYSVIIIVVTLVVIVIATVSKFFANSNMFLFFLMLALYGLSIIGISFSLTPFFSKAQVAGVIASLSSMMISLLYLIVSLTRTYTSTGVQYTIPVWARWLLCLLSPVSLALAVDQAIYLDIVNPDGMTFSTITEGEFPLLGPLLMLVVDTVFYFLLAIYLDNVVPGEYGPRQPLWYIFSPSYWCRKSKASIANSAFTGVVESNDGNRNVERVSDDIKDKVAVSIDKLTKTFTTSDGKVTAVNELSLDIYEGQITALLGHNGAGKTTTLNILTGLTGPTSGLAQVSGLNVSDANDMAEIRSMTGICPQHNILFEDLTCLEHLQLFAGIKGVKGDDRDKEIEDAINSVGLAEQRDIRSKALSGGQKRKLSVAIAIIGDPKIIFLDEPTAGMDPFSRRHLWSVLKEKKVGRVILLTTHFMDEADILADRKAIINKGSLRCCGSSLFLKNRFGIGYHLNMVVDHGGDTDGIKKLVKDHIPECETNRVHGQELDITLPLSQVSKFADLFNTLEARIGNTDDSNLGISSYGISMTTLEEVFLELEKENDETDVQRQVFETNTVLINETEEEVNDLINMSPLGRQAKDGGKPFQQGSALSRQKFGALLKIKFLRNKRNGQLLFFQLILPIVLVVIGLIVNKNSNKPLEGRDPKSLEIGAYYYSKMKNSPSAHGRFGPIPSLLVHDDVDSLSSRLFLGNLSTAFNVETLNSYGSLMGIAPHYLGINLTQFKINAQGIATGLTALYNDSASHAIPAIVNLMTNSIFKIEEYLAGKPDNTSFIRTSSLPWPASFEKVVFSNAAFSSVILLAMAFVVIPSGFGIDIVKDRQTKVRSQLRIAGVSYKIYWGSYVAMDIIKYIIPALLIIIITLIMQVDSLQQKGAMFVFILMVVTCIPASLLLSYVVSFGFDKWETAQAVQPLIFFFAGFMPYLPVALIDSMTSESTASLLHIIFCCILPPYTMFGGLFYIDKVYRSAAMHLDTENIHFKDYLTINIIAAILIPLLHVVLNSVLLKILDTRESGGSVSEALGCQATMTSGVSRDGVNDVVDEDDDVRTERQRVQELLKQPKVPAAVVCSLRKEYSSKSGSTGCCQTGSDRETFVAVDNLSFAVDMGEVFGLLGPNGAGKSTTLNVMTADLAPTRGQVLVGGQDVRSKAQHTFSALGFCPQLDPLWESVTLKEHLQCYSKIRGIKPNEISTIINFYMEHLQLKEHADKHSKKLSGGTKRKLSYCMSMLGQPKFVLLDEPSTGMDPQSKRFLWDTISSSFTAYQRGAVLTTHYMEEADALCSRIAIMVNGKMQCIGSSQHLKNKYGSGYLLEIKLLLNEDTHGCIENDKKILHQFILQHFPDATCTEEFSERMQYKIPRQNVSSLALVFSVLEQAKTRLKVEEYSFSQSTLEQVFLDFAKMQQDEGEKLKDNSK